MNADNQRQLLVEEWNALDFSHLPEGSLKKALAQFKEGHLKMLAGMKDDHDRAFENEMATGLSAAVFVFMRRDGTLQPHDEPLVNRVEALGGRTFAALLQRL